MTSPNLGQNAESASCESRPAALPAWLRQQLRCPVTGEELADGIDSDGAPVLLSPSAGLSYPVRDGVPVLLPHEAKGLSYCRPAKLLRAVNKRALTR
ncbi:Uncharacterised protein [Actinomyces bovis]|uniref:Tetraacyldisaccharide 4'-kinase n=1 Tax=Actinomyces bovis TaxID=1658 RepID=A0ABY1VMK8_9ACTO|nr:hypothetical protein [Actinomyces bovis]SPT53325.1 Uncharacterised protein [Actinomyces bovis]VEG52674.1 Uncharacterised protein [Actinomyces israelii]